MGRIRTIKPEFWANEDLSALPESTHLLAASLLNYADDFGYFNANPALVKAGCSPIREPSVSLPESFRSLQTVGYIRLGTGSDGKRYGHIVKFSEHQRVSHPTKSKIAHISITWDEFDSPPENLRSPPESLRPEQGTGNREQGSIQASPDAGASSDLVWGEPVKFLASRGCKESSARSFIGRLLKSHDPDAVLRAFETAIENDAAEPRSYVEKCLSNAVRMPRRVNHRDWCYSDQIDPDAGEGVSLDSWGFWRDEHGRKNGQKGVLV